ncbi:transglutaminase family protein [Bowmanella dokdonensis]|uniref:Transglutaminase family protein n=1 Tax=Bowmanella dokdonensis TaxID=751969 RepID=A0A939DMV3_9ALTE|nr:transglutaminase family protein [Bowmanella dokdonensis]MBN7825562.1 transglutaminase family protein [Bowmanella dokdonensis]
MTITVGITHHTEYHYEKAINLGPHVFRLRPAAHSRTPVKSYSLKIYPEDHFINWQQDPFGNYLARVVFPQKTCKFWFTVDLVAEMTVINPFDFFLESHAETFPFSYEPRLQQDLQPYLECQSGQQPFRELVDAVRPEKQTPTVDFLVSVNQHLYSMIEYGIRLEPGVQTIDETLEKASGSCRDSAWLLVQLFRHLGLAARFVSGYLIQLTADEKSLDGPSGPKQDFTDLHAWTEVYVPGAGWIGLDPTSGLFAGEGHIPLACTPEPASAAPVTGAIDQCESTLDYSNQVTRLKETPRVTRPYSEEQWRLIEALGYQVDEQLARDGVELTMGGEPTFISIDDMESAQWNTAADGKDKRRLAHNLFLKMCDTFAEGELRHYGQGKWYPGEPLPRWQYACYWRKDGQPLWQDPALLADINQSGTADHRQAGKFAHQLARQLGLKEKAAQPAYEDVLYHLWQEGNLAEDPGPDAPELLHAMTRQGFLAKLERGLEKPAGYVLPLQWDPAFEGWQSCIWTFRRAHCFLLPGDSPMGYRLPLQSLGQAETPPERDPADIPAALDPLPDKQQGYLSEKLVTTAMAVEVRDGRLYVFMPPLSHLEHYLMALAAVEATARELKQPVVLEGYTPAHDPRLEKFAVTPDPGVIEVNVHPCRSWSQLVDNTTNLYHLARESRLGTEKFMLDGRHTGTGGGNHVTLGGATPAQSPFLRRPDLLRSFITYWQHHPGLSYLFSSMFIGPTSQAPRVDEARNESLYELEIAFSQMPAGETPAPWLVDRLLRNLLVDLTGNTHRAEFCIDKLYSPDSPTGRLGLVEFRGFEMPPHARMSLVQMLLLRTLLAWFWQQPYQKKLVRWGTELHDKFLLPYFVKQDIQEICRDLQQAGYPVKMAWFEPFLAFRFPLCGVRFVDEIKMELRAAIEPWHVLGEEATSSGTARFVDSSLERVQLRMTNLPEGRYIVSCNGRRVPLHRTARRGEFVAGIRFRAWHPPSALHPTIGVHAPLVFDLYDSWSGRSVGGFTYHVSHPGGRNFATFPVNAFEAEGRRIARFWQHGHTPPALHQPDQIPQASQRTFSSHDSMANFHLPEDEPVNPDYPNTLDLRRNPE